MIRSSNSVVIWKPVKIILCGTGGGIRKLISNGFLETSENDVVCRLVSWQLVLNKQNFGKQAETLDSCLRQLENLELLSNPIVVSMLKVIFGLHRLPEEEETIMVSTANLVKVIEFTQAFSIWFTKKK